MLRRYGHHGSRRLVLPELSPLTELDLGLPVHDGTAGATSGSSSPLAGDRRGLRLPVRATIAIVSLTAAVALAWQHGSPVLVVALTGVAIWMQQSLRAGSRDARHLRTVIDGIDEPVIVADPSTLRVTYANRRATAGTGWTPDSAVGRYLWEMSRGLDTTRLRSIAATLRVDGPGADMEHRSRVEDDEFFWRLHLRLVEARTGPQLAVVAHDVTAQRVAEQDLREREMQYRHLAEESSGVVYRATFGAETRLAYLGPRLRDVLGDDPADVIADPDLLLSRIHPEDGHPFDDITRRPGGVHNYRVRHRAGHWVTIEDRHRPVRDAHGTIVASHGVLFDVTERVEAEAARARALAHERELSRRLEQTAQVQRTFLQSVSHEVRTPLTVVRGVAHTLERHLDELAPETARQLLGRLHANVDRLDGLLADLLDLERLHPDETGQRLIELDRLCRGSTHALEAPQHEFVLDLEPATTLGDDSQLRRAVRALLDNAVRHTSPGTTVTVRTRTRADEVTVEVLDDGPGVDDAVRDRMFEPFAQGSAAADAASPGTGIGLTLAQTLAAAHGGALEHADREGGGSCFTLRLPSATRATAPRPDFSRAEPATPAHAG